VLQFKNEVTNEDITYVGINQFIEGLKGCSNIEFFEALHTSEGDQFLFDNNLELDDFYNSRMAKAFLGYARRDLKKDFINRHPYILKCIYFAENIINKDRIDPDTVYESILFQMSDSDNWNASTVLSKIDFVRKSLRYV
jgi:hypothetical protein